MGKSATNRWENPQIFRQEISQFCTWKLRICCGAVADLEGWMWKISSNRPQAQRESRSLLMQIIFGIPTTEVSWRMWIIGAAPWEPAPLKFSRQSRLSSWWVGSCPPSSRKRSRWRRRLSSSTPWLTGQLHKMCWKRSPSTYVDQPLRLIISSNWPICRNSCIRWLFLLWII